MRRDTVAKSLPTMIVFFPGTADGEPENQRRKRVDGEEPQPGFCNRSDFSFFCLISPFLHRQ